MRRSFFLGLTFITAMAAFAAYSGTAAAADDQPCGAPYWHNGQQRLVQDCPLWRGHVPVLETPDPSARVVGYLEVGGSANWFFCQGQGAREYHYQGLTNIYYAFTMADNGHLGFVPEVFFSGGGDNEADGALARC